MGIDQPFVEVEKPLEAETDMEDDEDPTDAPALAKGKRAASEFQFPAVWNPCEENRIFITNSIASWDADTAGEKDTMTITFSVQDQTIQTARIRGVLSLIRSIPTLKEWLLHDTSTGGRALWNVRWEALGRDVIRCSIENAHNYSMHLKEVFDKNEENLKEFIASNPGSKMAKKHRRVKLLEAAKMREQEEQEAREKEEKEEEDLRMKEERYAELIELEKERLEKAENQIEPSGDEEEQRQKDLDETAILETELIGKSGRYRKLFFKELERLESGQAQRELEQKRLRVEKILGTGPAKNKAVGDDHSRG